MSDVRAHLAVRVMAKRLKASPAATDIGLQVVELSSWREFFHYVDATLPNPHDYIFRGQREASWKLQTSLDRAPKVEGRRINIARHLEQFRLATRGRSGVNRQELDEQKWWALGQHYGLWTPLLDWTESPFVALFFAFSEPNSSEKGVRAVFALSRPLIQSKSKIIAERNLDSPARPDILEIITPETDENARLVSQRGLFTRGTTGIYIEKWIETHFDGKEARKALVKIAVPERRGDRLELLRTLNRMNINHLSLFPDLEGSAQFCNMRLSVAGY